MLSADCFAYSDCMGSSCVVKNISEWVMEMSKKDVADMMLKRRVKWLAKIWRWKMENKRGQVYNPAKTIEKFGKGAIGTAIAFGLIVLISKGIIPADITEQVKGLLPIIGVLTAALAGLIEGLRNLIKFFAKE